MSFWKKGQKECGQQEGPFSKDDVDERDIYCLKPSEKSFPMDSFLVLAPVQEEMRLFQSFEELDWGKTKGENWVVS